MLARIYPPSNRYLNEILLNQEEFVKLSHLIFNTLLSSTQVLV
jgi:hypothetical protein